MASIIDMVKKEMGGFKVKPYRKDIDTITSQATTNKQPSNKDVDLITSQATGSKAAEKDKPKDKPKAKAKPAIKKLKDTSGDYYTADGISGDYGSDTGELGADMGKVNKGGYDPESEGMKRGGKVKKMAGGGSASSRGDGCAQRGKTRGRFV